MDSVPFLLLPGTWSKVLCLQQGVFWEAHWYHLRPSSWAQEPRGSGCMASGRYPGASVSFPGDLRTQRLVGGAACEGPALLGTGIASEEKASAVALGLAFSQFCL